MWTLFSYIFSWTTLWYVVLVLYVPSCAALIGIVLLQKGKGGGFGGAFGMGGSDAVFGPRTARSLPQRLTYGAAAVFLSLALVLSMLSGRVGQAARPELVEEADLTQSERIRELLDEPADPASGAGTLAPLEAPDPSAPAAPVADVTDLLEPSEAATSDAPAGDAAESTGPEAATTEAAGEDAPLGSLQFEPLPMPAQSPEDMNLDSFFGRFETTPGDDAAGSENDSSPAPDPESGQLQLRFEDSESTMFETDDPATDEAPVETDASTPAPAPESSPTTPIDEPDSPAEAMPVALPEAAPVEPTPKPLPEPIPAPDPVPVVVEEQVPADVEPIPEPAPAPVADPEAADPVADSAPVDPPVESEDDTGEGNPLLRRLREQLEAEQRDRAESQEDAAP